MSVVKGRSVRFRGRHLFFFRPSKVFTILLLACFLCFMALPLIYTFSLAFKPIREMFLFPPKFFVRQPTLQNFKDLLTAFESAEIPFSRYFFNSLFVTVITVAGTVVVSTMGAYGLVKHRPKGADLIFALVVAALSFSTHVTQIPSYVIVRSLGMMDSFAALIIPKIGVAYNLFLIKQTLEQMPDAYLEAARLDGANEWQIYTKITMPFLKPACATLVVFSFISSWNDYFSPVVYITNPVLKTMPLAVQNISGGAGAASISTMGAMAAASIITLLPTVIIFTTMQTKVLSTMAHSGIK